MGRLGISNSRSILRAASVTGVSTLINVAFGLLRMKVAALLLGPAGIGLVGLLQSAMGTAATIGDFGMRQSGARRVAIAIESESPEQMALTQRALNWCGGMLALISAFAFYLLSPYALKLVSGTDVDEVQLRWLSVGVGLMVAVGPPFAILNGYRRVGDMARATIWTAILAAIVSIGALFLFRKWAVVIFVMSAPIINFAFYYYYANRIPRAPTDARPWQGLLSEVPRIMKLGSFVLLGSLSLAISELTVKALIKHNLDMVELGLYSATWIIGTYYVHFLMTATSYEFYPRLVSHISIPDKAKDTINSQIEVLLLVSGPIFLTILALGEFVLQILYSSAFTDGAGLMRLMVMGDVFRIFYYPLGFVLLAASAGRSFLVAKLIEGLGFVSLVYYLLPRMGLVGVGLAHILTFGLTMIVALGLTRRATGYHPPRKLVLLTAALFCLTGATAAAGWWSNAFGAIVGLSAAFGWTLYSLGQLNLLGKKAPRWMESSIK